MGLFNRKKKELVVEKPKHKHIWKDMPWYMEVRYSSTYQTAGYDIIEPYVCITCGERKDITLESHSWDHITIQEREKIFSEVRDRYKKYLQPEAVVEDMIHNIQLVKDPHLLHMMELRYGIPHMGCGTSTFMEVERPQEEEEKDYPKIEVHNDEEIPHQKNNVKKEKRK